MYETFSDFYDLIMEDVSYEEWLLFLKTFLKPKSTILDLACGSGTLAVLLKIDGYDVEGLDISPKMLEQAKTKAKVNHLDIPFYEADMTNFNTGKKYNIITCLFDSINHLKSEKDIKNLLDSVDKHLNTNGYLICDIISKQNFKTCPNLINDTNLNYTWKIETKKNKIIHTMTFKIDDEEKTEIYTECYYSEKIFDDKRFNKIKNEYLFQDSFFTDKERNIIILQKK